MAVSVGSLTAVPESHLLAGGHLSRQPAVVWPGLAAVVPRRLLASLAVTEDASRAGSRSAEGGEDEG